MKPNIVFLFGDQHRAQATGYAGNNDVKTPNIDFLARNSINITHAISSCPVCSPFRASLLTGTYPLTNGVFVNDVPLQRGDMVSAKISEPPFFLAEILKDAGYSTAYIGKWHLDGFADVGDGNGDSIGSRFAHIPKERRCGFDYWKVMECTHDYNNSLYWDDNNLKKWDGYDAIAQTKDACRYIEEKKNQKKPFCLFLSWGPPHAPYHTAPTKYQEIYEETDLEIRPNVLEKDRLRAEIGLLGYYSHVSALDDCVGMILTTLHQCGLDKNTILVFTSDHGDMLYSQGKTKKQSPWDESIRVPFLIRWPNQLQPRRIEMILDSVDIMPTMLSLCQIPIPEMVEGKNLAPILLGDEDAKGRDAAFLNCAWPFAQWWRDVGGREYRGLRTLQYTYVHDLDGPWLLYDNVRDPYQLENLINNPSHEKIKNELDSMLQNKLKELNDDFLYGGEYMKRWGYEIGNKGAVPYSNELRKQ